MNVDQAVDRLIQYFDNISATQGGYGNRTARTLVYLQQVYDDVWNAREWQFKLTSLSSTYTTSQTAIALPADYAELGTGGGFFTRAAATDKWQPSIEESVEQVADLIEVQVAGAGLPETFAIYSGAINFPYVGAAGLYRLRYSKVPKTLVYGATPTADTFEIPLAYHNSVLIAGTIVRMARGKGDVREDWERAYRQGMADMILRERPVKSEAQFLPDGVPPLC